MLKGKKILLGISGSIAAYKSASLVRLLIKAGAEVKVVMTPSATTFIAPLTLSTLSKNEVLSELSSENTWANHVLLGRWADIMLIAPLSCNTLAKMSAGLCDNLLMAVYLSATCPVIVAPAMDEDMWLHPSTKNNIRQIQSYGNQVIPVENGELASGLKGEGRMAEPEQILQFINDFFFRSGELKGKKVLVTAGPTYEAIDPVRFIGNHSSGKMGIAIAEECKRRGADVTLVCGPVTTPVNSSISLVKVKSASEMYNACMDVFPSVDIAVMSAAVADYTVEEPSSQKIKKNGDSLTLHLQKTKDILKALGVTKNERQLLIGFALETNNEKAHALKKLHEKNADMIVLNSLNDPGAGFGYDTNKIVIFDNRGSEFQFETKSKKEVASDIINTIIKYSNG
ncbi:MAG: bifunctional phosphopantothenoylcysteine decarboxylase/phosphopantothenate--cysteine ligase CoaBC [Bacteroidetes bacterium]|nr:bifunctional phosphopantothenoylcysteine decarboxylase/phosphopantothenate--cysteine ligase CoaBC [Bacteroidota bacterium]